MSGPFTFRGAAVADLPGLEAFLADAGLPMAGVREALPGFLLAERDGRLAGTAALEVHGENGVLRSVAVAETERGGGLGSRLSERTIDRARAAGLRRLYLLTTTAERYFPRLGFRPIERGEAPPAVLASIEFREACPASAVAMILELDPRA